MHLSATIFVAQIPAISGAQNLAMFLTFLTFQHSYQPTLIL